MKKRKIILIIMITVLITLVLTLNSFATESSDNIINTPDTSIENENKEDNGDSNVENDRENTNTGNGQDNTTSNDNTSNDNIANDSNNNENEENNSSDDSYEEIPNQSENQYTPPITEKPTQTQRPTYNVVEEKLSDNADLRNLSLDIEGLSPEFDKNITEYYLIVDLLVETVNIEAYPEDDNSIVMIDGNTDLQEGENTITITVKSESGNTKTYTINVTKTDNIEMVNANLKSLAVKGFNFYPTFKNNIYNYNLMINEKISRLEITAETEIEEATYEIIGNENLVEGDNSIKIIVTAKDGVAKREYKLNVYISSGNVEIQEVNKKPAIILLSVLGIAIIVTVVAIAKKNN